MEKIVVIGSLNMDYAIEVDKMPVPGETVLGKKFSLIPGGKGANQAYTMGKLKADVSMIGAVGKDNNGERLVHNLEKVGVDTSGIEVIEVATGSAFIQIDKTGENSIIVIPGANHQIATKWIEKNRSFIEQASFIVMQLEIPLSIVSYVIKMAKEMGKKVILDPAPAIQNLPEELYQQIEIIKPNETELKTITQMPTDTTEQVILAAKSLVGKGVKNVIVTLGAKGSVLVSKDTCKTFSAANLPVVDTTAAGDSFTGALVTALSRGETLEKAIEFAHLVSSIVVTKKGAQTSIPSLEEVQKWIKRKDEY